MYVCYVTKAENGGDSFSLDSTRMPQGKTMVESEFLLLPCLLSDSEWNCDKYETTLTPPLSPSCVKVQTISESFEGLSDSTAEHFGLRNEVRHDCMWSGTCSLDCLRKKMYRPRTKSISEDCFQANPLDVCGRPTTPASFASSKAAAATGVTSNSSNSTTCEDTSNLVNTTLNDHCYSQATQQSQKDSQATTQQSQKCTNPAQRCTKKIATAALSDTPSDSDSEIDVVSCSWHKKRRRESPTKSSLKVQCRKRQFERQLMSSSCSGSSSRSSSDSEDTEKRSQHNSMERKRRDDLRFAFEHLRDIVPALKTVRKAPKVLILSQAEQYVKTLCSKEKELERIVKFENKKNVELTKRLRQLRNAN